MTGSGDAELERLEGGVDDTGPSEAATVDAGDQSPEVSRPWQRYLVYVVAAAFLLRVVFSLWHMRGWFFTNDDWDFITRDGWGTVLDPHAGHIQAVAAAWTLAARGIVGLDYWPGYALLAAVAWPLVGLSAWFVWGRMGVDRRWAAAGAVLLMWVGSAAFIQFSHAGLGIAIAASILAIYLDGKCACARHAIPNVILTIVAILATSSGGLIVLARAGLSLIYRRWNGVIAAGSGAVIYLIARMLVDAKASTLGEGLRQVTHVVTTVRAGLEMLGSGASAVIPWPATLGWILGLALIALTVWVLAASRLSYFAVALIGGAGTYAAVSLVVRILGRPSKLRLLFANNLDSLTAGRFANLPLVLLIVALVPLLAHRWSKSRQISWAALGLVSLLIGFNVWHSAGVFEEIADKSEDPQAAWVGAVVEMRAAGEPGYSSSDKKIDPRMSNSFTLDATDFVVDRGLADSLLASDIFWVGQVPDLDEAMVRGRLRFYVQTKKVKPYGGWEALGETSSAECQKIEGERTFPVGAGARFRLERLKGEQVTLWWSDSFGLASREISHNLWNAGKGTVYVELTEPLPEFGEATLTVESPEVRMCFE